MAQSAATVAWGDLLQTGNLQKLLTAVIERLDRSERTLADLAAGGPATGNMALIPAQELRAMQDRLAAVENTSLQQRLEALGQAPSKKTLSDLAAAGQTSFSLAKHMLPLSQLKSRIESTEAGLEMTGVKLDETNARLTETIRVLHETLEAALAKMVTKDEFKVLETKHYELVARVDKMEKDLVERLERMIREVQAQVDAVVRRVTITEQQIEEVQNDVRRLDRDIGSLRARFVPLEEQMPLKADKAELEAAIAEIRAELEAMNIEEIMEMAKKANERIDLMDIRCDAMDTAIVDLKAYVLRKEKELEEMQLEKQIEAIRQELAEAKQGLFTKALKRIEELAGDAETLRGDLTATQGQVQVNRENIGEVAELVRQAGGKLSTAVEKGGSKAELARFNDELEQLKSAVAAVRSSQAQGGELQQALAELSARVAEVDASKADQRAVEVALAYKADKDAVARDTELNQRAVDEALSTMNAGTQGIQQLLERQEGAVAAMVAQLSSKPSREELAQLQEALERAVASNECSAEQAEAIYGRYGTLPEDAAIMTRRLDRFNCISCNRPLKPEPKVPMPTLPLLPGQNSARPPTAHIPAGGRRPTSGAIPVPPRLSATGDSLVEMLEVPGSLRSTGGAHTSPRKVAIARAGSATART